MSAKRNGELVENAAEAQSMLAKCLDDKRVDVLRSLLAEIEHSPSFADIVDKWVPGREGALLHMAVDNKDADAVRALLAAGANPCVQNMNNRTPLSSTTDEAVRSAFAQQLLHSIAQNKLARVCQLLSAGVPIDTVDSEVTANTPLHWAASYANVDVVKMLCDGGARVNQPNAKGETCLHDAVRRGDAMIVKELLSHGGDPSICNHLEVDCAQLARDKQPALLQMLSLNIVQDRLLSSATQASDVVSLTGDDSCSVVSMTPSAAGHMQRAKENVERMLMKDAKIDTWSDWLWPPPHTLHVDPNGLQFTMPKDHKLKVYFDADCPSAHSNPMHIMQVVNLCVPILAPHNVAIDFQRWYDNDVRRSPVEGVVICGISPALFAGHRAEAYRLTIETGRMSIYASDIVGMRNAWFTLLQIIRAHPEPANAATTVLPAGHTMPTSPPASPVVKERDAPPDIRWHLPVCSVLDYPSTALRGVLYDFTGCRVLTCDTLCQIVSRLCLCKMNALFVHFEVRPTDRFSLSYTGRDIFHLQRVCADLHIQLVPSLNLNSGYVEAAQALHIIDQFMHQFPNVDNVHFGRHATEVLMTHRHLLVVVKARVSLIYITCDTVAAVPADLPVYVVVCIDGRALAPPTMSEGSSASLSNGHDVRFVLPMVTEHHLQTPPPQLSTTLPIVTTFSTADVGYLCQSPESTIKNAMLAAKLPHMYNVVGSLSLDVATGMEIMPHSLSYTHSMAVVGAAWNTSTDIRRVAMLLPHLTAEQVLLDRRVSTVCQQMFTLGYVEHELTRLNNGLIGMKLGTDKKISSTLSVFVQMLLNPDNMTLERLTPVAFKKARIELRRSLQALHDIKKELPYNFELALTVAEVQLVTELMILAAKLGQALCTHGARPSMASIREEEAMLPSPLNNMINVGVGNLPLTTRTDLANNLLELRNKFQHTWLSRNLPSTLPNALKIFDNLFKALLPPDIHSNGYL